MQNVLLNPSLVLYFRNYESAELSTGFVLIVSVHDAQSPKCGRLDSGTLKSSPNDKILNWSKFKAFADDNSNLN